MKVPHTTVDIRSLKVRKSLLPQDKVIPNNAEAIEVTRLFEREFPPLAHHPGQIIIETQVGLQYRPGVDGPQLNHKFYSCHGIQDQTKQNDKENISLWYVLGNGEEGISKIQKGLPWMRFPESRSSHVVHG